MDGSPAPLMLLWRPSCLTLSQVAWSLAPRRLLQLNSKLEPPQAPLSPQVERLPVQLVLLLLLLLLRFPWLQVAWAWLRMTPPPQQQLGRLVRSSESTGQAAVLLQLRCWERQREQAQMPLAGGLLQQCRGAPPQRPGVY